MATPIGGALVGRPESSLALTPQPGAQSVHSHTSSTPRGGSWPPVDPFASPASCAPPEAKTVKRMPPVGPMLTADVYASRGVLQVGDIVSVVADAGRWTKPYINAKGTLTRWYSPHDLTSDGRCIVAFPAPLGCRILEASNLVKVVKTDNEGDSTMQCHKIPSAEALDKLLAADYVLNAIIRRETLKQHQKLIHIDAVCQRPEGEFVSQALAGNGWNADTKVIDGYPLWPRAVAKLSQVLGVDCNTDKTENAQPVAARQMMPRDRSRNVEVPFICISMQSSTEGEFCATCCHPLQLGCLMLQDGLRVASLTSLDLREQNLTSISIKSLLKSLLDKECLALKRLCLAGNPLQDQGALALVDLLKEKQTAGEPQCELESLDVSQCMIWTRGCMALVTAATQCSHLRALSLAGNDAGFPTCGEVAKLLQTNTTLVELDLFQTGITPSGMDIIANALPSNSSLLILHLGNNTQQYDPSVFSTNLFLNPYLRRLTLPPILPSAPVNASLELQSLLLFGYVGDASHGIVLPAIEMQIALCMGVHMRLGSESSLRQLSEGVLFDIIRLASTQRQVILEGDDATTLQNRALSY